MMFDRHADAGLPITWNRRSQHHQRGVAWSGKQRFIFSLSPLLQPNWIMAPAIQQSSL